MNTAATSSAAAAVACSAGFAPKEMRREVDKCRPHSYHHGSRATLVSISVSSREVVLHISAFLLFSF